MGVAGPAVHAGLHRGIRTLKERTMTLHINATILRGADPVMINDDYVMIARKMQRGSRVVFANGEQVEIREDYAELVERAITDMKLAEAKRGAGDG